MTVRDISEELGVPMTVVLKCLMEFGHLRTVSQELDDDEISLVRENAPALKSLEFVRGRKPPPRPPGGGSHTVGVREPRRPRPSHGAAGAIAPASDHPS